MGGSVAKNSTRYGAARYTNGVSAPTSPPFPNPEVLSRVLTNPQSLGAADLPHVQAAWLGGRLAFALPEDHPLRPALRGQMLDLALRHAKIKAELLPLLAAWEREGIPALLFKGFALAEFEYGHPSERFYGDVDILLPADQATVMRAAHIAMAHGWRSDGQHADMTSWTHESAHLYSPGKNARIDVHRYVLTDLGGAGLARVQELTAQVWQRAQQTDWEGVKILRPDPLDAIVVNLLLGRSWTGDLGGLKPADYPDLQVLMTNDQVSPEAIAEHAQSCGAKHTWLAFKECCDPAQWRFELNSAQIDPVMRAGVKADGVRPTAGRWLVRYVALKRMAYLLPETLGDVVAAWWVIRQGGDPRTHLQRWTTKTRRRLSLREMNDVITAIGWWTRLFYPKQRRLGVCVPRAYATYRALSRRGHPVIFVSGVARTRAGVVGHAWIEDDQGSSESYGEPNNRRIFRVLFQFPEG